MTDLVVIMSVYKNDNLKFVRESVQSILDQTFKIFDFYIVFDGPVSTDIDRYISSINDNRIRLFRLEQNGGLASALNFLLEKVMSIPDYKLIARMDADDISLPLRFEKQRAFLSENTEISIVGSWYEEIDESGNHLADRKLPADHDSLKKRYMISLPTRLEKQRAFLSENTEISIVGSWYEEIDESGNHLADRKLPADHDSLKKRYMTRTPFAHPSVMYRRQLIEKAGSYPTDTVLMEDNVLWGKWFLSNRYYSDGG